MNYVTIYKEGSELAARAEDENFNNPDYSQYQEYYKNIFPKYIESLDFPIDVKKQIIIYQDEVYNRFKEELGYSKNAHIMEEIDTSLKEQFHTEINDYILSFIGDSKSTSLTLTYGFADKFIQLFPQDEEYVDGFLKKHQKNVILAFDKAGARANSAKVSNIFTINNSANDNKQYKSRIINLLKKVFKITDVTVTKIDADGLSFSFEVNGSEYILVFVNSYIYVPTLILHYEPILTTISDKILVCSMNPIVCENQFMDYTYLREKFSNMIYPGKGISGNKNVGIVKTSTGSKRINRTTKKIEKNMWNGFGGKKQSRKFTIKSKRRN
jgi:hypothetical protein